jgi:hypothetical protein
VLLVAGLLREAEPALWLQAFAVISDLTPRFKETGGRATSYVVPVPIVKKRFKKTIRVSAEHDDIVYRAPAQTAPDCDL